MAGFGKNSYFSQNSVIFNRIELRDYLSYTCDQVVKIHLFYQESWLAHTCARAACAQSAHIVQKPWKMQFSRHLDVARGARGNSRAPKKISDLNSPSKIDAFWLFDHCHISKTRRDSECWSLAKNKKIKFSDFKIRFENFFVNLKQNMVSEENFKSLYLCEFRRYEHVVST